MRNLPILITILLAVVLSACAQATTRAPSAQIEVTNAWVRAVAGMEGKDSSSALYMVLNNNSSADDTLLNVETDVAGMVQIHLSEVDAKGISSMRKVEVVEIPAGGTAEFKSGGYHVMMIDLKRALQEGDTVSFTLTFKNSDKITIKASVKIP